MVHYYHTSIDVTHSGDNYGHFPLRPCHKCSLTHTSPDHCPVTGTQGGDCRRTIGNTCTIPRPHQVPYPGEMTTSCPGTQALKTDVVPNYDVEEADTKMKKHMGFTTIMVLNTMVHIIIYKTYTTRHQ